MANEEQMLKDHQATWKGFARVTTVSLSLIVIVLLLMRCTLV